jgi:putative ABC transport system permease protein
VEPGFDARNVLSVQVPLPAERYAEGREAPFLGQVLERIGAIPGVRAVGATNQTPFSGRGWVINYTVEGRESSADADFALAGWRSVTPDFFRAMGIPLVRGRTFTPADTAGAEQVIIVSSALARRWWPGEDPIGKRFLWGGDSPKTVVGVVGDVRDIELESDVRPLVFRPFGQLGWLSTTVLVRTDGDPRQVADAVRDAIWSLDPELALTVQPLQRQLDAAVEQPRFSMLLVSALAGVALLLAAMGTYGMMAFSVAQRTRELGIRLALGAQPRLAMRLVLRHGSLLALTGIGAGLLGALALTRFLRELLYQTSAVDLPTFAAVGGILWIVAVAASYLPARRAMRVDPMLALRSD